MDDLQAIRRLKNGDIGGLEILIACYQAKAVRTAYLVTHNEPLAEDVVQDAFVRFYERARLFDERRPFEPYFLRIVVNSALNALEKESRAAASLDEETDLYTFERLLARANSVEEQVEFAQMKRELHQALGKLSPRQRAVAVQRYYLEMSEKEMTEALDIAPGTVKWLLNAARARLRNLLGSERSVE
ncbi:MAG: sigma-70 family RNA polymerase sigma factor [Chloroflexi bacterium]|nr:MAG: sigma-70 family RNA polymerase sigma factor [Chloroflexota bacterium]